MKIEVYSDGSGNSFDDDGGWGWQMIVDGTLHSEGSGYLKKATNNTAELTAAIEGLKAAVQYKIDNKIDKADVTLVSDSQLVLGYASGKYKCNAVHLAQLFIEVKNLYSQLKADVKWVKGHSGDEHNEKADALAKIARTSKGALP